MDSKAKPSADAVRQFVLERNIEPARRRGERVTRVAVGEVHKSLGWSNRVPLVVSALKSGRFLKENRLVLREATGPPSGQSTTVVLTFEIQGASERSQANPLWGLRGAAKENFAPGELESFVRTDREALEAMAEIAKP